MSEDDGRKQTRRRDKTAPQPQNTPRSLDDLPIGQPLAKNTKPVSDEQAPEPERQVLDSAALLEELNNLDPEELGRLLSAGAPKRYRTGDKVSGEVVRIRADVAFVDIGAKSEATFSTEDMDDPPSIGDTIEAYILHAGDHGIHISQKLGGKDADLDSLEEAMAAKVPVDGRIAAHNSGGLTVRVGQVSAFCPRSQIDRIVAEDLEVYLNQTHTFRIIDIEGSKVVLSRRVILDEEMEEAAVKLWETIAPGDTLDGIVANVRDFGVFVDIGGIQGLVSKRELGWDPEQAPLPRRGDKVRVRVLDVDKARKRVSLSLKDPAFSPWNQVGSAFIEGETYSGTISRLTDFGAFIRLAPGVEGLCHISNISKKRVEATSDVLSVGEEVKVRILSIDHERKRLGLGIKQAGDETYVHEPAEPAPPPRAPASLGTMGDLFGGLTLKGSSAPARPSRKKSKKKKRR